MASLAATPEPQSYLSPSARPDDGRSPAVVQRRAGPSGGGHGRAWSEEEENYLIETRQHKMPYKHIAAHLQKTELACRLHYHQLSLGTKGRRRRASSGSSHRSAHSGAGAGPAGPLEPCASRQSTPPTRSYATLSPPESPETRAAAAHHSLASSPGGSSHHHYSHPVPILPRPRNTVLERARCLPPPSANALGLITLPEADRVDAARLARAYDAHRGPFWAAVARDYGDGAAPALLEDAWRYHQGAGAVCGPALPAPKSYVVGGGALPPTPPNGSPASEQAQLAPAGSTTPAPAPLEPAVTERPLPNTFSPINGPCGSLQNTPSLAGRGAFAIASLLTEARSPRP